MVLDAASPLQPEILVAEAPAAAAPVRVRGATGRALRHRGLVIGVVLVGAVIAVALLAPLLSPHDPYAQDLVRRLVPPIWMERGTWLHPLGTDNLGRDYLSRTLYGPASRS